MDRIKRAFLSINREDFLPQDLRDQAYFDSPIPIGFGQTNSQPSVVESMLGWLNPQPEESVLDVGSGSGWTTALLSRLVGPKGKVYAVEIIPELLQLGRDNCQAIGIQNATFFEAKKQPGLLKHAPYDRILVSAGAGSLPAGLLQQLRTGGKLVIPIQNDILEITKMTSEDYDIIKHPGYVFVPLL